MATSDIVSLCGIDNLDMVPAAALRAATERGTALHKAVEDYEMGQDWQAEFPEAHMEYLRGYFNFRDDFDIQVLPPMEKRYVYLHDCDLAIGCTIDMRFIYKGNLYIGDLKSCYRQYGKALKQLQLKWRLQTWSYYEATGCDPAFLTSVEPYQEMRRAVIHVHPKYKKGYEFYEFLQDDADLWRGAVLMAQEKVAAGLVPQQRETYFKEALEMSNELSEDSGEAYQGDF